MTFQRCGMRNNKVTPSCRAPEENRSWDIQGIRRTADKCKKPSVVGSYLRRCKETACGWRSRSHSVGRHFVSASSSDLRRMPRSHSADLSCSAARTPRQEKETTHTRTREFHGDFQTIPERRELASCDEPAFLGIRTEKKDAGDWAPSPELHLMNWDVTRVVEVLFGPSYANFEGCKRSLLRQARDLLVFSYGGNLSLFVQEFCIPAGRLIRRLECHVKKFGGGVAGRGWPLCYGEAGIVLHLGEIDEGRLRIGDCYVCLRGVGGGSVELALLWRDGKRKGARTIARGDGNIGDEILTPLTMSEAAKTEDDLPSLLQNLVVSVEHAMQRVPIENLAFPCPVCHEYYESEEDGEKCGCEFGARARQIEKKDSCIQTSPMFEIVGSIPHIDSDEDAEGREEEEEEEAEESGCPVVKAGDRSAGPVSTGTMTRKSRELVQPKNLEEVPRRTLMSGIQLPGTRDVTGHPLVVFDSSSVVKDHLSRSEIAKVLLYYVTIPEESELGEGVTILMMLQPQDGGYAEVFDLLDQALHLAKKRVRVHMVLGCLVEGGRILSSADSVPRFSPFPKTKTKYRFAKDEASLRYFLSPTDTPQSCGGMAAHDQLEWIEFLEEFEPFVSLCHTSGRRLVDLIREFRSPDDAESSKNNRRQIHHQQSVISRALNEPELLRLRKDGQCILSRLKERAQWLPSFHVRSRLEEAKRLFSEVDRAAKRLEQLVEKRRHRLKELLRLRALEEESSQVLTWLTKRGEECLKKHSELATSLQGIKNQEQDFEKFYFISMRHLDKGNDLLDEIGQTQYTEDMAPGLSSICSNLDELAKSLKLHLKGFGEKLEDTRERLEDTARCLYLLDKTYEWSLDMSKYVNRIKTDEEVSEEMARQLLGNIEQRLTNHPPLSEPHFAEMTGLAKKLDNEKLIEQCRVAHSRYQEAFEIVQTTQARLLQILNSTTEEFSLGPLAVNWNMIMSRLPGGTFNIGRRRSLASFPYIYKCSHHAAGHDCACDPSVTRDPSKSAHKMNMTQCQCTCGTLLKPLTDIREGPEDLPHQKIADWEYNGPRSAMKRHLRRTSTWQYPAEGFDDQDNNSNKSSHSGESDNKDLEDNEVNLNSPSIPISLSVNSHLNCHASNLSLNVPTQGDQVRDAKTQKTLLLIMREMIQTERDYVASLEYVIENYIPQLLRDDIPQALRGQRNVIFGNIEKIHEFHSQYFLQELECCEKSPLSVGQCFLKYEKKFYLYALYNKNKPKSDSLMTEYGSNFFKTKQLELRDKMDLASYLLKPVQRMGKYALLLQQLMKASGERESSDLSSAEAMVRFQLRHGNDLLAMDSLRDCDVNLKEQGRLLRQNEFLVWQGKGKKCLRQVFLFEELILFSKARRFPDRKNLDIYIYKHSIKTTDIGLTAKIGDSPTKFEIWFRKRKPNDTFTLQSMSEEVKQAWTEELSGILWKQALKNREMRLQEMSSMGIGNKPCLDIRPSADQINDRSISVAQLSKTAPRFRNSIAALSRDILSTNKRPHSIISVTSSSSSGGSTGSGSHVADSPRLPRSALHSQCSAESGIITDMSLTSEELEGREGRWHLERSNSTVTSTSLDSSLSPVLSSDDVSAFVTSLCDNDAGVES